ncbi:MAG: hypothetical protein GVY32_10290 [Gammaproteobacteria bacterium]|jgi:hypothetical protein|nr:hypothetical protein [Gammaproteobacteria bacterium]
MNELTPTDTRPPITAAVLYGLAVVLIIISPVLGLLAAAVATWQALLAGSIWYMPLGLILVLATIAMVESHKPFDLALLGLVVSGVIAWFTADVLQQGQLTDALWAMAAQTGLMSFLLVAMVLVLMLIHAARRSWRW